MFQETAERKNKDFQREYKYRVFTEKLLKVNLDTPRENIYTECINKMFQKNLKDVYGEYIHRL